MRQIVIVLFGVLGISVLTYAARIKDITSVVGERGNPLTGTGLVAGLQNTGDSKLPSAQALASFLRREDGLTFNPNLLTSGSIALVAVTAELGPYSREGSTIDINVSTLGDAKSLQGGTLLATELKGLDGQVYAVARTGAISTASWTVEGQTGSKVAKNHPTSGRIPNGAHVEREERSTLIEVEGGRRYFTLALRNFDLTTAQRIQDGIDTVVKGCAEMEDPGSVRVYIPDTIRPGKELQFIGKLMEIEVEADLAAVVVINEKTGTIVAGGHIGISETAIAQGNLVVKIKEQQLVSQPLAPFTENATTEIVPDTSISVTEEEGHLIRVPKVVTVTELVDALNTIGATPRDLIAIFNALREAKALHAELKTM
ncbi:MAG: flagellar basal body P-ring protein FlgI [Phycisphaerae bacterium]|nr:flagellar basal body P-ring protein FlgI [Phycisphaerae bacterium]